MNLKVIRAERKSACPGQVDGTFFRALRRAVNPPRPQILKIDKDERLRHDAHDVICENAQSSQIHDDTKWMKKMLLAL